jgi:dipeptidyl aminopeptidase/acylaminoacyl peptidase
MIKKLFSMTVFLFLLGCTGLTGKETYAQFKNSPFSSMVISDDMFEKKGASPATSLNWSNKDYLVTTGVSLSILPIYVVNIPQLTITQVLYKNDSIVPFPPCKISPDGKYIAYNMGSGGIGISKLSDLTTSGFVTSDHYIENHRTRTILEWSPDSQQLAMLHVGENKGFILEIYDLPYRSLTRVFEYDENVENTDIDLGKGFSWSFDGEKLAFPLNYELDVSNTTGKVQSDIFIYNIKQNKLTKVTSTSNFSEKYPAWYPKGDILMFVSAPEEDFEGRIDGKLVFSSNDGACVKLLPSFEGIAFPSWSPDGSQIAYLSTEGIEMLDVKGIIPQEYLSPDTLCKTKQ